MAMRTILVSAKEVRALWFNTELTVAQAAAELGMDPTTFQERAKMLELPPRKTGRREVIRPQDEDRFTALWNAGVSSYAIAGVFGCSYTAIRNAALRLGLEMRGTAYRPKMTLREFHEQTLSEAMAVEAGQTIKRLKLSWGSRLC